MKIKVKRKKKKEPFYLPERDGITQGMLVKFMSCRYKAHWFTEGWSRKSASMGLVFGSVCHYILELAYKDMIKKKFKSVPSRAQIKLYIERAEKAWRKENSDADARSLQFLEDSLLLAEVTIPAYFDYHRDSLKAIPWVNIERNFSIPLDIGYTTVPIRGKMDGEFQNKHLWLFETKCLSRIDEANMVDTLSFDVQVRTYLWALWKIHGKVPAGVLYNVLRRSGLQLKKGESKPAYRLRVAKDIEARPDWYFIRYEVSVPKDDQLAYDTELRAMVDDLVQWQRGKLANYHNTSQCIQKYGRCEFLPICAFNNVNGYTKRPMVYRELEDY